MIVVKRRSVDAGTIGGKFNLEDERVDIRLLGWAMKCALDLTRKHSRKGGWKYHFDILIYLALLMTIQSPLSCASGIVR